MNGSSAVVRGRLAAGAILLALGSGATSAADVAGSRDHPLLTRYPGSEIIAWQSKDYDAIRVLQPGTKSGDWASGRLTWIVYRAPAGSSTLQIFRNYQAALQEAGFEAQRSCQLKDCGSGFVGDWIRSMGRMVGDGEAWMPNSGRYLAVRRQRAEGEEWVNLLVHERDRHGTVAIRLEIVEPQPPRAVDGSFEIERLFPGAKRFGGRQREYDEAQLPLAGPKRYEIKPARVLNLEGEVRWQVHALPKRMSALEPLVAYERLLSGQGHEVLFRCGRGCGGSFMRASIEFSRGIVKGSEHWIDGSEHYRLLRHETAEGTTHTAMWAYSQPNGHDAFRVAQVRSKPLDLGLVKVDANAMAEALRSEGRVVVYGIYFDHDQDRVRAESAPVLDEIAAMLRGQPELALYVDGHTDASGSEDYNLELSQRRASAVVRALTETHGVAADRLQARGFGWSKPVASNDDENGRARNRRVELAMRQD